MPLVPSTGLYRAVTTAPNLSADMTAALSALYQGAYPAFQTITAATYTQLVTDGPIIFNSTAGCTYTLLTPSTVTGRVQWVKTISAFAVVSASANVVPLVGGTAVTAILPATAGKWALLQADGTTWQIMASN